MSLPGVIDEWAEAARELAKNCRSKAAQRQARHKALNLLPAVESLATFTLAHKGVARSIKTLMIDMSRIDQAGGPWAAHAAVALEELATVLQGLPRAKPAAAPPETIPYNPGARD